MQKLSGDDSAAQDQVALQEGQQTHPAEGEPNADRTGPVFSILSGKEAASQGGNGAQRREYDRKIGAGRMSRAGATCVCCGPPSISREDLRLEGEAGRL
jgi:putative DNA methylase